jgi:hypothetical protein
MATKVLKLALAGLLPVIGLTILVLFSCDKRNVINLNENSSPTNVGSVRVSLSPRQIRLPSPEAIDSVQILIAVLDAQGVGMPNIKVNVSRTPDIGFVTNPDSTDSQGRTTALFITDPGIYDSTRITAAVGNKTSSALLFVSGPSQYVLDLNYSPPIPKLIDHEGRPYNIIATLVDSTQRGVSGQPVTFASVNLVGRIGFFDSTITIPRTNSQGLAQALFYNTITDELQNPEYAKIQAVTSSPDGQGIIACSINLPMRSVHNTMTLAALPSDIIANGTSYTTIRAFLRDSDGHAIAGDTISFRCLGQSGVIPSIRITDESGIATAPFTPFGGIVSPETTQVQAEFRPGTIHGASSIVDIRLLPVSGIGQIIISPHEAYVVADGHDTLSLFASVFDSTGNPAVDGTAIYFENTGLGILSASRLVTVNGQARNKVNSPTNILLGPRIDSVFVQNSPGDSASLADTAIIHYVAGPISQLAFVYPESMVTLVAGSGDTCSVVVFAVDVNGNPVINGTQIRFENHPVVTSTLTPRGAGTFDGFAKSTYLVGSGTGDDNVTAWALNPADPNDTIRTNTPVIFRCISANATMLELSSGRPAIQVGGSSTQIIATLVDAYGNPLSEGYIVAFDITVSPGSDPIQKPSFSPTLGVYHDTSETNINGQAIVQIYSGHTAGAVSIRACTIQTYPDSLHVCDEKSLITISSGPPHHIQVSSSMGGGGTPGQPERYCSVAALVWDRYTNLVEHGTAVYFSLIPDDLAEIDGDSYTGGGKPYLPDSTEGVAYTRIIYPCFSTYNFVQVVASSAGDSAEVADTSVALSLPIFDGHLDVFPIQGSLWTDNDSCNCHQQHYYNCRDTSDIMVTLTDGGGCPVSGGIILFTAQVAGSIIGQNMDTTNSDGHAYTSYMIRGCDIPCDPYGVCTIETIVRAVLMQDPAVVGTANIVSSRTAN